MIFETFFCSVDLLRRNKAKIKKKTLIFLTIPQLDTVVCFFALFFCIFRAHCVRWRSLNNFIFRPMIREFKWDFSISSKIQNLSKMKKCMYIGIAGLLLSLIRYFDYIFGNAHHMYVYSIHR